MTAVNLVALGCAVAAWFYGRWQYRRGIAHGWAGRRALPTLNRRAAERLLADIRRGEEP